MDERLNLKFYIMPNSQIETDLNQNGWISYNLFQNGKVISKLPMEFSNEQKANGKINERSLVLSSSEKVSLIKDFFAVYSDKFAKLTSMTGFSNFDYRESKELEYVNLHFIELITGYNYPSMRGFIDYITKNGFVPDSGINIPKKGFNLGLPERTVYRGRIHEEEIKEIGNLALLVDWNFIFENEILNIPQKYDSRISILKNHQYDEQHLFSMCVPSLTPIDRSPVIEAYKKLKN